MLQGPIHGSDNGPTGLRPATGHNRWRENLGDCLLANRPLGPDGQWVDQSVRRLPSKVSQPYQPER